jgi:hypothetical protein
VFTVRATSGTGMPSADEPKEDQTGVAATVGGGPPADGQDMRATPTGASDTAGAQNCDNVRIFGAVIGHLEAEIDF